MNSLRTRLLTAASLVLTVFVAVTGAALIQANRERALLAQQQRMEGLVYSLLGAADVGPEGDVVLPAEALTEARFLQPASGLAARIFDGHGNLVWRSRSALMVPVPPAPLKVGESQFVAPENRDGQFRLDYAIRWYSDEDASYRFNFQVTEAADAFFISETGFARRLWLWLLLPAVILLIAQLGVLTWALRPLRHMAVEVKALEAGRKERVDAEYPRELKPLQRALNALLTAEEVRRQRYTDALADLSHSLKTPLAAVRTLLDKPSLERAAIDEHLGRMDRIIRYQLGRAAAGAPGALQAPHPVAPVVRRLGNTLAKVHAAKRLRIDYELDDACTARIGEDALFESLGNLLDNACKWGDKQVRITLHCGNSDAIITVDDDGPGFPDADLERWTVRGARADQRREGQGIGLTVANDIIRASGGRLELARSPAGGARVRVRLPA